MMSSIEGLPSSTPGGLVTNSFPVCPQKSVGMLPQNNGNFKEFSEKSESGYNGVKMSNSNSNSLDDKPTNSTGNVNGDGHEENDVKQSVADKDNLTVISKDSDSLLEGSPTGDNSLQGSSSAVSDNNDSSVCDKSRNNNLEQATRVSPDIHGDSKDSIDSVISDQGRNSSRESTRLSEESVKNESLSEESVKNESLSEESVKNESLSDSNACTDDKQDLDKNLIDLGNKVRNSFKDIMSKIAQDKDSGLGKIPSRPKSNEFVASSNSSGSDSGKNRNIFDNIIASDSKELENSNSSLSSSVSDQARLLKSDSEMEGVLSEVSKKIAHFPTASSDEDSNKSKVPNGFTDLSDNAIDNDLTADNKDLKAETSDETKENITFPSFIKKDENLKSEPASENSSDKEAKSECMEEELPVKNESETKVENSMEVDCVKNDEELDRKTPDPVINSCENSMDSVGRGSTASDRKRPIDCEDSNDSRVSNKRSRLEDVIGKLGSQLGVEPSTVEEKASTPAESDNDNNSRPVTESDNEQEDDKVDTASSILEESEDEKSDAISTRERLLRVTEKEISRIVQRKIRTYLKKQKDSLLSQMTTKIAELHVQNDHWKQQAKKLQAEVLNLTVLNQKLEKRKAATAALRQINTRSLGVQVDETKADLMAQMQLTHKSPGKIIKGANASNTTAGMAAKTTVVSSPQVQNPHIITQLNSKVIANKSVSSPTAITAASTNILTQALPNMKQVTNVVPSTSNSSLIRTIIAEPSALPKFLTTIPSQTPPSAPVTSPPQLVKLPVTNTVRNLIEMTKHTITKDSINSPKTVTHSSPQNVLIVSSTCAAATSVIGRSVVNASATLTNPVTQVVGKHSTVKIIDLTADDDKSGGVQGRAVQQIPPANISQAGGLQLPQGSYIISTAQGSQIVNSAQGVRQPGGLFQMVLTSNTSTPIKPGSLLTVVPPRNFAPPLPTQATGIRPSAVVSTIVTSNVTQIPQQVRPGQQVQLPSKTVVVRPPQTSTVISTLGTTPTYISHPGAQRQPPPPYAAAVQGSKSPQVPKPAQDASSLQHPAPLPSTPSVVAHSSKLLPPKPSLKISRVSQGIVLSWNMTVTEAHSDISTYQLFAYQEGAAQPNSSLWKKVGDVKALPLPMACTLTQFQEGNKYHFAVRALDQHGRMGQFSDPSTIHLLPQKS